MQRHSICLDTETTGLDPQKERVCEIAAIRFNLKTYRILDTFHVYINPEMPMPYGAYRVHGLSDEFLEGMPVFSEIVDDFKAFVENADIYIHNADFDVDMLDAELNRCGAGTLKEWGCTPICTLRMAQSMYGRGGNRLDNLCAKFGISTAEREKHGALIDTKLLLQVLQKLQEKS